MKRALKALAESAVFSAAILTIVLSPQTCALGETMDGALAKAYANNASLNSARTTVRVTDEGVAIAMSGYRPVMNIVAGMDYTAQQGTRLSSGSFGIELDQMLFDGFQTRNTVRSAESRVFAARENLRNTEQNILFNAASAYMDVIRDRKIAELTRRNLSFLNEVVNAARLRCDQGEGTQTDVAQAEASRASARSQLSVAQTRVATSEAFFREIVGESPGRLELADVRSEGRPKSREIALRTAATQHPAILANQYLVDTAAYQVRSAEGALLPQVRISASMSHENQREIGRRTAQYGGLVPVQAYDERIGTGTAFVGARVNIPIYQGGRAAATVRQNKESLGVARIEVDVSRDQVRAAVESAWAQYASAVESVGSDRQRVASAKVALNGVTEESRFGMRTVMDVLDAQAYLINAQIALASTEHDAVVASYALLSSVGELSARRLKLKVALHEPAPHYLAVKDSWAGLRTADGR